MISSRSRVVAKAFEMSEETYGYRRIHAQLVHWGARITT
jgi:hypothetical protein